MSFAAPAFLLVLLVVPAAVLLLLAARRRARRYPVRFTAVPELAQLVARQSWLRRHGATALFLAALAALAVALARPRASVAVPTEQATVVLVTDTSRSMLADDVDPTRLRAAQRAARSFLDKVPAPVRVGSIAYSDSPHTVLAPTTDRDAVRASIAGLEPDGATATGDALNVALNLLERRPLAAGHRTPAAIVLLSDGKTTTGTDPVPVARRAHREGVPIFTVSLGTSDGVVLGPSGELIPVPPDPVTLHEIAAASGGKSFRVSDENELDSIYQRLGSRIGTRTAHREITAAFAAGGLLLLLGAAGISLRTRGLLP